MPNFMRPQGILVPQPDYYLVIRYHRIGTAGSYKCFFKAYWILIMYVQFDFIQWMLTFLAAAEKCE